ncbi:MAG: class I SAM-dependent methyltransferase [Patescibacteria group bacterium]
MGTGIVLETQEGPVERPDDNPDQGKIWDERHGQGWLTDRKTGQEKPPEAHFLDFLERYGSQIGPRVLDAACGPARHTTVLAQRGLNVTGVDISPVSIEQAKQRLQAKGLDPNIVEVGDLYHLEFADREFDTVVNIQTLGHMSWQKAKEAFGEMSRVLKPEGLFFLRVRSNSRPLREGEDTEIPDDNSDLPEDERGISYARSYGAERAPNHSYSLPELQWLASQNGLQIVGEPLDEQRFRDGAWTKGQWNVVFRKEVN